jgi:hypothetical protein
MTLLLSWVAPDGIVMGADSALTWQAPDGKTTMTLADAYKIIPFDRPGRVFGVSFVGLGMIGQQWTSNWLRDYVAKSPLPGSLASFAGKLAERLNGMALAPGLLGFQVVGWELVGSSGPQDVEPRFFEVSNLDRATSRPSRQFSVVDILPADFIADVRKYRGGDTAIYPMRFGSAGSPMEFSTEWIANTFVPAQTKMVGVQIPQPNITSVAEYVRFLIGMVADSLRIARQPATVNRPVETLLLFPDLRSAFSTRY